MNFFSVKFILTILSVFSLRVALKSQTTIKGAIIDKTSQQPIRASVLLKAKSDSLSIEAFTFSDNSGNFHISHKDLTIADYFLEISSLGYQKKYWSLDLVSNKSIIIPMTPKGFELNQVVLQDTIPIRKKGDTLFYNVSEFSTGREKVVEDILKNLPRVDVDKNGTVRVEGKEIEKIMVEGDDFFEKGYQILSQSMPSWAIEKVEVLNKYNENRLLKNVENSDKVALNIGLKDKARFVWFGEVIAQNNILFPDNRNLLIANIMQFAKKHKFYTLINSNNIGLTKSIQNFRALTGFSYDNEDKSLSKIRYISSPKIKIDEQRYIFNNTQSGSFNYIYRYSDSSRFKILSLYSWDHQRLYYNSNTTYISNQLQDKNYFQEFKFSNLLNRGFVNLDWNYDIGKNSILKIKNLYYQNKDEYKTRLNLNSIVSNETENDLGTKFKSKIEYFRSFSTNKVLEISSLYFTNTLPQQYSINQFYYPELFSQFKNIEKVEQNSKKKLDIYQVQANFKSKTKNKDLWEIIGQTEWINHHFKNDFLLFPTNQPTYLADDLSNNIGLTEKSISSNLGYTPYIFKDFDLKFSLSGKQTYFTNLTTQINYVDNFFSFNPKVYLKWEINEEQKIGSYIECSSRGVGFDNLLSKYLWKDAKTFTKGISTFNAMNNTVMLMRYHYGSYKTDFSFDINTQYIFFEKYFASNIFTYNFFNLEEKYIAKNQPIFNLKTSIDYNIEPIKNSVSLEFFFSTISNISQYNSGQLFKVDFSNYDYYLQFNSMFSGVFNYTLSLNLINETYRTQNVYRNNLHTRSQLALKFQWTKKLFTLIEYNNYFFKNLPKGQNMFHFLDPQIIYHFRDDWEIFIEANNLTSSKYFTDYKLNSTNTTIVKYDLYPRYIFIGTKYKF